MLSSKIIRKLLYRLFWFILTCLISGSLYAFYYRISYINTSGERANFYIKTNAFAGGREIHLNTGWLQQHSTFSSFGSFTVVNAPGYRVERVEAIDTLGHSVFNIQGGPVTSTEGMESSTQDMGAVSQIDRNDAHMIHPGNQLSRAVLPVLQMIEGELSHSDIQGISRVDYVNGGDQFDLYVHFISPDSGQDSSTEDNVHSLLNSLVREGVISAWRHRSRSIRQPEGNMYTVVLSGLFATAPTDTSEATQQTGQAAGQAAGQADSRQSYSASNNYSQERLSTLLARFLETNWNGINSLAFQVGYSGGVYIALNNPQRENEKIIYDINKIYGFSYQILNRSFETMSEDIVENRSTERQWPYNWYYSTLSAGYHELIRRLRSGNLATVHRSFNHNRQSWHSIQYYLISSVFKSPTIGESYQASFSQRMRAIVEDIKIIKRKINMPDLCLKFRFINIEDERGMTHVNFMLESYINNDNQRARTLLFVRSVNMSTSILTMAMPWQPISISVQVHNNALSVTSAPLSQYFSSGSPGNTTAPGGIPLDVFRNNDQETDEENCNCIQIRGNRFMSE